MSPSKPDRIAVLQAKKDRIEAQLARHKARQLQQDKKRNDRLKVLLGEFLFAEVTRNQKLRLYVQRNIFRFHTKKRDRDFLASIFDEVLKDEEP